MTDDAFLNFSCGEKHGIHLGVDLHTRHSREFAVED